MAIELLVLIDLILGDFDSHSQLQQVHFPMCLTEHIFLDSGHPLRCPRFPSLLQPFWVYLYLSILLHSSCPWSSIMIVAFSKFFGERSRRVSRVSDLFSILFLPWRNGLGLNRRRWLLRFFVFLLLFIGPFFCVGPFGFVFCVDRVVWLVFFIVGKVFKGIRHLFMAKYNWLNNSITNLIWIHDDYYKRNYNSKHIMS